MSGFYNNWVKVQNPGLSNDIVQMRSGGFQPQFYFGGSQVPNTLGLKDTDLNIKGNGINNYKKENFLPSIKGKTKPTTEFNKSNNIHIPRHIKLL